MVNHTWQEDDFIPTDNPNLDLYSHPCQDHEGLVIQTRDEELQNDYSLICQGES